MAPEKHEFYKDLDGTVNYRISERWVLWELNRRFWAGSFAGMLPGFAGGLTVAAWFW